MKILRQILSWARPKPFGVKRDLRYPVKRQVSTGRITLPKLHGKKP